MNADGWSHSSPPKDAKLDFYRGRNCDMEDFAVTREPGVGPTSVVADSDRRAAAYDSNRISRDGHQVRSYRKLLESHLRR
jgi:hypothetical protein